jgi:hypothetical protein
MTTSFEVVEAKRWMCGRLARSLRGEHAAATARVGVDAHRGIRDVFGKSYYRRALLIDGHVAAMWGLSGTALAPMSHLWLAMTERATHFPIKVVKTAKAELAEMMQTKIGLVSTIIDGDEAAKRFSVFLGWAASDGMDGAAAESIHGRRRLREFIDHEPGLRTPQGTGSILNVGYFQTEGRA